MSEVLVPKCYWLVKSIIKVSVAISLSSLIKFSSATCAPLGTCMTESTPHGRQKLQILHKYEIS